MEELKDEECKKKVASGITIWWLTQGRFSEERIISKIRRIEGMCFVLLLMQIAIVLLMLSQL